MKALRLSETLVIIYQSTRSNILEEFTICQHRCKNLKSF